MLSLEFTICGVGELDAHCLRGVSHVISILDPEWPTPGAFLKFSAHERLDLRFHDVIDTLHGATAPGADEVARILTFGRTLVAADDPASSKMPHLLIHCHMGVSRSTAAAALVLAQAHPEMAAKDIISHIVQRRPQAWPNLRMMEIGDKRLKRGGELVSAVRAHYRRRVAEKPELVEIMSGIGRDAELVGLR